MTAAAAFFYLFSAIMIASAFMVISARNPVHSVLFLILAFVNAAGQPFTIGRQPAPAGPVGEQENAGTHFQSDFNVSLQNQFRVSRRPRWMSQSLLACSIR